MRIRGIVGRAFVALSCAVVFIFVTPTLVLCESLDGHTAIEPMTSPCCQQAFAGGEPTGLAPSLNACGDACVDTPLVTHAKSTSLPSFAKPAILATAVLQPPSAFPAVPPRSEPARDASSLRAILRI